MCPMRFILVFFSLIVAAYLALKAFWFKPDQPIVSENESDMTDDADGQCGALMRAYRKIVSGVWMLVDMASGRYLWKTMARESVVKAKSVNAR